SMPLWIRVHLVPATHTTKPLDTSSVDQLTINGDPSDRVEDPMTVVVSDNLPDAWVLSNQTITPTGEVFTGPADPQYCGPDSKAGCEAWIDTLGLRQDLTYHPASNFWPLQWAETGIFLGVAVLLAGFCFWWTRRRLT
ncbi:MAG: transporter, partial [Acidimicrobiales bacterium]